MGAVSDQPIILESNAATGGFFDLPNTTGKSIKSGRDNPYPRPGLYYFHVASEWHDCH
jgi:hypothetical protein